MKAAPIILDIAVCIAIAALALLPFAVSAAGADGFIENKGQIHDQFRKPNASVLYLLNGAGVNVQLRRDGFAYDTYSMKEDKRLNELDQERGTEGSEGSGSLHLLGRPMNVLSTTHQFHRIDLRFSNGNPEPVILSDGESEDYSNIYTDVTGEAGATFVRSYATITYRDVWPNIDVRFNYGEEGFKYDVIVRPGGDLGAVRFEVKGAVMIENVKGELVLSWADGALNESIPASWIENGQGRTSVHAHYTVNADGTFGFACTSSLAGTLVIDPTIQWTTYYGGTSNEGYANVSVDDAGNSYLAGTTSSTTNIATAGSYDAVYTGGADGYLVKFTPAGARLWGTYFGGSSTEDWVAVKVNGAGTAALAGYTASTSGIASAGAYQTQLSGNYDAFLMLFNTNGTRQWGTYYGGGSADRGIEASIALNGRVALVGETISTTGIASTGAPDVSYGGAQDGFVVWFTPTGTRLFGSYLGGSGEDSVYGVEAGFANSEFVVTGYTKSTTGIATTGAHDVTFNGDTDAFMALYNGSGTGTKTWCTYYGGPGADYGRAVTYTSSVVFVMCGHTSSTTGIATAGSDQPSYGGGISDGFHASFDRFTKARIRGSYAGGTNDDHVIAIAKLGNQGYAIGAATFSAGQATPGSYGPTGPGRYVAGYTSGGVKNWSGYFPDSELLSIGIGANSTSMAVVVSTSLGAAVTTPGAHQPTPGGSWDLVLHRLVNTAPPLLLPVQDEPVGKAFQYKLAITDGSLSILPEGPEFADGTVMLRIFDATGRTVREHTWNGGSPWQVTELGTGTYVLVAHPRDGAPRSQRFLIP